MTLSSRCKTIVPPVMAGRPNWSIKFKAGLGSLSEFVRRFVARPVHRAIRADLTRSVSVCPGAKKRLALAAHIG